MRAILGIHAAWTPSAGCGVALAVDRGGRWCCAGLAPTPSARAIDRAPLLRPCGDDAPVPR
jgi:hypothetical protein